MFKTSPGGAVLEPGIHFGVLFNGVTPDKTWLDIQFNKDGAGIRKRMFEPTGKLPIEGKTAVEVKAEEENRNITLMVQVLQALLSEAELEKFGAKDYASFVAQFVVTANKYKGAKVNLKVVVDKTGAYSDIPRGGFWVETFNEAEPTTTGLKMSAKELKAIEDGPKEAKPKADSKKDNNELPF